MSSPSDTPLVRRWRENRPQQRRSRRRSRWLVGGAVTLVVLGAALTLALRRGASGPGAEASFVSCTYGGYVAGRCGTITVPEDPLRPGAGKLALHVAVLPATVRPAAGALFYLEGGPGVAATRAAVEVNRLFAEVGRRRDIVMVDQRGTGGSAPLSCPDEHVPADDAGAVRAYLRDCFARLGGHPALDTTSLAADDVEAVRRALRYGKVDLYGGSYGATLAQAYLRAYPASVRTVVLDGAALPDVRIYDVSPRNAERALDAELGRCSRASACRRDYPHTRQQLAALLARPARRVTLESGPVLLRPDDVAWTVNALSESADSAATIPYAIDAAVRGDYTALGHAYVDHLGPDLDVRARLAAFWVILCSEPWAAFDPAATARAAAGSYLGAAAVDRARLFRRACAVVPTGRVPAGAATLETSRVPVLLLAGSTDPIDPVANLRGWRRAFPNGRLVVVAGGGHGAIAYDCVQRLVADFVSAGSAVGLDATCARRVPLPAFETG
jgi:pimeloyl-ACP methyl ester carboxylesterase